MQLSLKELTNLLYPGRKDLVAFVSDLNAGDEFEVKQHGYTNTVTRVFLSDKKIFVSNTKFRDMNLSEFARLHSKITKLL